MGVTPQTISRHLRSLIRGVEFDAVSRRLYATDAGLTQIEPLGVVSPRDTQDVVRLVAYATERGLSVVPRGMGSGLNGGAVGPGIQVDFSRYMNSVIEVGPDASWVRVQPGVVLAQLNALLRPRGVFFPPDPSSENHCSLGGMIGTNASGARTVAYGATKDHVLALDVVMADASLHQAKPLPSGGPALCEFLDSGVLAARAFSTVLAELTEKRELISTHMPRVVKNSCGYRVETLLGCLPLSPSGGAAQAPLASAVAGDHDDMLPLQKLFVGAEGTLGIVTEATLHLAPLPPRRGIAMAYFPSVCASGEAVPGVLALQPTAVEIMDSRFLALVRRHDPKVEAMLPEGADTALLIEFEATDIAHLEDKFAELARHLSTTASLRMVRALTVADTEFLWRVRKSAVPLMQQSPGRRQPLPFIEDITVNPARVPECIEFLQKLFDRQGVQAVMVGHVGDGNLHTRPMLDPRDPADRLAMQRIYDRVAEYVLDTGGTLSGEHGDGLVHTPRLQSMYGPEVYQVFVHIKEAFDPAGVLNPGKKVAPQEADHTLLADARYGTGYSTLPQRPLLYFPDRGFESEIERCHGCAACKSSVSTTMCPTYRATRREHASPRAKANLLRAVVSGAVDTRNAHVIKAAKSVIDYCIGCGMCAAECPSRVNIPKLVLEAKGRYRQTRRSSSVAFVLGRAEALARLGSAAAPLANLLMDLRPARLAAQMVLGIDRRRPMAPFARRSFRNIAAGDEGLALTGSPETREKSLTVRAHGRSVAYFPDLFADYYDPDLARAAIRVLVAHGIEVSITDRRASGITEMLYGFVHRARGVAAANVRDALPRVQRGAYLVSAEPTASFAFKVHYPDYLDTPECSAVADATMDLSEFLVVMRKECPESSPFAGPLGRLCGGGARPAETAPVPLVRIGYHLPCHLKAQQVGTPSMQLLSELPGVEVINLNAGCCGMAGTFGMKADSYDLSLLVGEPLFRRIAEVAPDLLASECSTCRMQLAHATGLPVVHPVELLAEAYGV
jgi:FAD/FMN-containing dehydrogenase/Fe-S oxidoreductase